MKRFIKTLTGKTIFFIIFVASIFTALNGMLWLYAYITQYFRYLPVRLRFISEFSPVLIGVGTIVLVITAIITFVALMYASGRRADSDDYVASPLHIIPFDLEAFALVFAVLYAFYLLDRCLWLSGYEVVLYFEVTCMCIFVFGLGLCMSAAARLKLNTLFKKTFIYCLLVLIKKFVLFIGRVLKRFFKFVARVFNAARMSAKVTIALIGITFLESLFLICSISDNDPAIYSTFWLIEKLVMIPAFLLLCVSMTKLAKGAEALAKGDLSYVTDTKGMHFDFKTHGENLNRIAVGMSVAVEEKLKSERMKTELITNVSHDIKTPLTSIINYASLIGNENSENPKISEYADVLVRQSDKLKRLIEDLVEASKASTGNIEISLSPCDACIFVTQSVGEYEDKLKTADLSLITLVPDKELFIMADGRRMWRIFDNLMNNICKYAQPGTRVYLSLEATDESAVFTFKNTSREPLNISETELMERFVRGDASRNTEGNGLGLSIAESMAKLQGGELKLSIDGDLFKAILKFPLRSS